jgi:putative peptidoglycan lipid II flippase
LGSYAYGIASLLFHMPYGIIGVALLTALLPRMSRAALRQDRDGVVQDLSLGTRLSALGLLPVTAALIVLGPSLAVVGFAHGKTSVDAAAGIGQALALGAFGLLPMAVTLLQLRVFYAMRDARTPTLVQIGMVAVRVPMLLILPAVLAPEHVVAGIMIVTSLTYVAGWVIGDLLLRRRLGPMQTRNTFVPLLRIAVVSAVAGITGELVIQPVHDVVGPSRTGSLVTLLVGSTVIGGAALAGVVVARLPEIRDPLAVIRIRLRRG